MHVRVCVSAHIVFAGKTNQWGINLQLAEQRSVCAANVLMLCVNSSWCVSEVCTSMNADTPHLAGFKCLRVEIRSNSWHLTHLRMCVHSTSVWNPLSLPCTFVWVCVHTRVLNFVLLPSSLPPQIFRVTQHDWRLSSAKVVQTEVLDWSYISSYYNLYLHKIQKTVGAMYEKVINKYNLIYYFSLKWEW